MSDLSEPREYRFTTWDDTTLVVTVTDEDPGDMGEPRMLVDYDDGPTSYVSVKAIDHDGMAWAQHVRSEHEATHGEAEQCGADCIRLGLATSDDEDTADAGDGLRDALASGNYLQVYDHRQNRWLSPDEAVAALRATDVLSDRVDRFGRPRIGPRRPPRAATPDDGSGS
jgi:hypothetical protein